MLVRRIARPMLASTFVAMGIDVLRKPGGRTEVAAPLVEQSRALLPGPAAALVPADPENAVRLNALVQIGGGLMLATGKYPRIASSVLAATLLPTTVAGHPFWAETDPERRQIQQVQFLKNISILGGLLLAAVDTEGKPSLGWRGRRAAAEASAKVADALPSQSATESFAESFTQNLGETAHQASERATALAETAAARGSAIADLAVQRGSALADAASVRGSALADAASVRGSALADRIVAEAPELRRRARKAAERADHAAKSALAKAEELRHNLA
ncbi:DoxX family protein [Tomitella biformata]|uniref:DoxX family protein n=1 Tax=Tomitella biformata TaxID=630403 RepID=UPI000464E269|nr:DoxX family protein [Tomitella biformata]